MLTVGAAASEKGEPVGDDPHQPPWPADRRLAVRLLVASLLGVTGAAVTYLALVRTALGQRFDESAFFGASGQNASLVAADRSVLQRITTDSLAVALAVIVVIGVARRRPLLGLAAAFSAGMAVVTTDVLKNDVLTRPNIISLGYYNTFPSGHTAAAVACAMALVVVSPPGWRGAAAVIAGGYGWVTAAQVQTSGWHRPSDAIGGAFLAFASVCALSGVVAWFRPSGAGETTPYRGHRVALSVLGVVGAASGFATGYGAARAVKFLRGHPSVAQSPSIWHTAYLSGVALTVTVVVGLLIVLLGLLGPAELDAHAHAHAPAAGLRGRGPRLRLRSRSAPPLGPGTAR